MKICYWIGTDECVKNSEVDNSDLTIHAASAIAQLSPQSAGIFNDAAVAEAAESRAEILRWLTENCMESARRSIDYAWVTPVKVVMKWWLHAAARWRADQLSRSMFDANSQHHTAPAAPVSSSIRIQTAFSITVS